MWCTAEPARATRAPDLPGRRDRAAGPAGRPASPRDARARAPRHPRGAGARHAARGGDARRRARRRLRSCASSGPIVPAAGDRLRDPPGRAPGHDRRRRGRRPTPAPARPGRGAGAAASPRWRAGTRWSACALALEEARSGIATTDSERPLLEQLRGARRGRRRSAGRSVRWFSPERLAEARAADRRRASRADGRPAGRGALGRDAGLDDEARGRGARDAGRRRRGPGLGPGYVAGARRGRDGSARMPRCWRRSRRTACSRALRRRSPPRSAPAAVPCGARSSGWRWRTGRARKPGLYYHRAGLEEARRRVVELCAPRRDRSTIARAAGRAGHQPQVRPGAAGALRRPAAHPQAGRRARSSVGGQFW